MNSEQQPETNPETEGPAPAVAPDKSLTLAEKKLAGSAHCLNCGTELKGPFCYFCGQPDKNFMRFFPALLRDLMEDVLDLDSRFMRTIKPLLFKPGRLTRDYMNGRRFRYAPPMRLYIFSSIVFFVLAAFFSSNAIKLEARDGDVVMFTSDDEEAHQQAEEALENLPDSVKEKIDVEQALEEVRNNAPAENLTEDPAEDPNADPFDVDDLDIQFNDQPWDRETNPVDVQWLPDWLNDRINDEIEGSPKKARQINENPNLIVDKVFDILPATMFVLLPVVAMIFKFWYLFAKRYYVEHLIFSLHNHSFIFVTLTIMLLIEQAGELLASYGYPDGVSWADWLSIIMVIWIPLYLLISLRTVYQQNWFLTVGKFFVIGISYVTLLLLVTTGVAITSFVLL
jgi:hypothetical protein